MGAGAFMSQHVEDPSKQTEAAAANLGAIAHKAASTVTETTKKITEHEEGGRKASATQFRGDTTEADLMMNVVSDAIGLRSLGDAAELISDRVQAAHKPSAGLTQSMGGFIGQNVTTFDDMFSSKQSFPLTDRIKNVSKFFTGKSDADEGEYPPKTEGMQGKQEYQEMTVSRMLHKQKYDIAIRMQQEYAAEQAYKQRMGLGMGQTFGGPSPGLGMTPKAPSFKSSEIEEPPTNWAAGNVTG